MTRVAALTLVLVLAAAAAAEGRPKTPKRKMPNKSLSFTLSTSADRSKLVVDIRWKNTTHGKVYLVDRLVVPSSGDRYRRSDRITVMNSDDPTVARFVLAAVSSDSPSYRLYEPTYEAVAPGAEVTRHFELPLPLDSWNPVGGTNPLSPQTSKAQLMVFGFAGEPKGWTTIPTDDATPIKVPDFDRGPLILESGPVALPAR